MAPPFKLQRHSRYASRVHYSCVPMIGLLSNTSVPEPIRNAACIIADGDSAPSFPIMRREASCAGIPRPIYTSGPSVQEM
jgi:hypothetical protein